MVEIVINSDLKKLNGPIKSDVEYIIFRADLPVSPLNERREIFDLALTYDEFVVILLREYDKKRKEAFSKASRLEPITKG